MSSCIRMRTKSLKTEKYRFNPFFKPDFAPDTLHTFNYITHFSVFKKTLLDKIGGFEDRFNGAQDFDIILRATEKAKKSGIFPIFCIIGGYRKALPRLRLPQRAIP